MNKRSASKRSRALKLSRTDWKRLERMRDEDIDVSDIPEVTAVRFAKAIVRNGLVPAATGTRRIDAV